MKARKKTRLADTLLANHAHDEEARVVVGQHLQLRYVGEPHAFVHKLEFVPGEGSHVVCGLLSGHVRAGC